MPQKPHFFPTPAEWRSWLEEQYADTDELWVGLYKRGCGQASITWPEAVDGALCFGWIDGVRKSIDANSYKIRLTPRKRRSIWSAVNIRRAKELHKLGLMNPTGLTAFEKREETRSRIYAYEQRKTAKLPPAYGKRFRSQAPAWDFFQSQAPWYQRTSTFWVIIAKKEETKLKRLEVLLQSSAEQRTIPALTRPPRK
jgi:uncharacterized protein YdeI (YjbR/CyaY-like superfamily)